MTTERARSRLRWAGAALAAGTFVALAAGVAAEPETGRELYLEYCASCHGANLEGQPHWQSRLPSGRMPPPPHDATGHTWHHPDRVLFEITKRGPAAIVGGRYESDMPSFAGKLSDNEIRAVLDYIKTTWPERERRYQAGRTKTDEEALR